MNQDKLDPRNWDVATIAAVFAAFFAPLQALAAIEKPLIAVLLGCGWAAAALVLFYAPFRGQIESLFVNARVLTWRDESTPLGDQKRVQRLPELGEGVTVEVYDEVVTTYDW